MIYILDQDPKKCAEMLDDKSLDKMILDIAQVLCNVHHIKSSEYCKDGRIVSDTEYFSIVSKIPLSYKHDKGKITALLKWTRWARECKANYLGLVELGDNLLVEHEYRGGAWKGKERNVVKAIFWARDNVPDLPVCGCKIESNDPEIQELMGCGFPTPLPFPLVIPKKSYVYKNNRDTRYALALNAIDRIESYRDYYKSNITAYIRRSSGKSFAEPVIWTNRSKPEWL